MITSFQHPLRALIIGASRGIGLALTQQLLANSVVERVFATGRNGVPCAHDPRVAELMMDVTDESSIESAARIVADEVDHIDLVVNCAGVLHDKDGLQPERRLDDISSANLHRSFAVNAVGPLLIAKHFQRLLHRDKRAVFATLSARVGSIGDNRLGGWYGYRASKAAQNMITKNLSIELRRHARGIICIALHPGTVDTELSRPFSSNVPREKLFNVDRAADQLLSVIDNLKSDDNGRFLAWDGKAIPW